MHLQILIYLLQNIFYVWVVNTIKRNSDWFKYCVWGRVGGGLRGETLTEPR